MPSSISPVAQVATRSLPLPVLTSLLIETVNLIDPLRETILLAQVQTVAFDSFSHHWRHRLLRTARGVFAKDRSSRTQIQRPFADLIWRQCDGKKLD
jgi:hypothetical protein